MDFDYGTTHTVAGTDGNRVDETPGTLLGHEVNAHVGLDKGDKKWTKEGSDDREKKVREYEYLEKTMNAILIHTKTSRLCHGLIYVLGVLCCSVSCRVPEPEAIGNASSSAVSAFTVVFSGRAPSAEGASESCDSKGGEWHEAEAAFERQIRVRLGLSALRVHLSHAPRAVNGPSSVTIDEMIDRDKKPVASLFIGRDLGYFIVWSKDAPAWYCIKLDIRPGKAIMRLEEMQPKYVYSTEPPK